MNARFWIFEHGWTKVTLEPGQTLHWSQGGDTDEGWHRESWRLTYDMDGVIVHECVSDGVDCDGRLTRYAARECPVPRLKARTVILDDGIGIRDVPDWQEGSSERFDRPSWQRDYSAEAMGY